MLLTLMVVYILPTTQSYYRESMTRMTIEILIIETRVRPGVPKGSAYPSLSTVSVVCNICNMAKKAIFISYYEVKIVTHVLKYVCLMVFNATSNNISVISWQSVLLVEETGGHQRPVASHWQTLSLLKYIVFKISAFKNYDIKQDKWFR